MVSFWDSYEDKLYTLVYTEDSSLLFKPIYKNHKIFYYSSEEHLLVALLEFVELKDPDFLAGWNFMRYDFTKLVERMKKYKIDYKRFSPFNSVDMRSFPYLVKGRIVFDLFLAFKQFTLAELRSYRLAYIAKEELNIEDHEAIQGPTSIMWDEEPEPLIDTDQIKEIERIVSRARKEFLG